MILFIISKLMTQENNYTNASDLLITSNYKIGQYEYLIISKIVFKIVF